MQSFTDQWQPRVGLIFGPGATRSQKVYGSFARFYEQIPLALVGGYYDSQPLVQLTYDHDPTDRPQRRGYTLNFGILFGPTVPSPDAT